MHALYCLLMCACVALCAQVGGIALIKVAEGSYTEIMKLLPCLRGAQK